MKKCILLCAAVAVCSVAFPQGFLNKIKNKINSGIDKPSPQQQQQSQNQTGANYTDPAQYGTLIYTYSKPEIDAHMGGDAGAFDLWFQNVSVSNNQLHFQMVDHDKVFDYTGGKVVSTGAKTTQQHNDQRTGSEAEYASKDFTQLDVQNAMLKKGNHVSTGMAPGKPSQTLVFNGKTIGNFYTYSISHNYDSTSVAVAAMSIGNGGMTSSLVTSNGQSIAIPSAMGAQTYISPDGKTAAAVVMLKIQPGEPNVYLTNGTKTFLKDYNSNYTPWLHNSGAMYCISGDSRTLYRNGEMFHTFDNQYDGNPKTIFISKDDKSMCWVGNHALFFSDGTSFENGTSPHRVILDGKEVIIFFAVNVTTGQLYLCKHDL